MNDTAPLNTVQSDTAQSDTAQTDTAQSAARTGAKDERRPVRPQTVVWGFILFAIAAVFFVWTRFDLNRFEPVVVITWVVLVLGALALLGGILGAVLRRLRR